MQLFLCAVTVFLNYSPNNVYFFVCLLLTPFNETKLRRIYHHQRNYTQIWMQWLSFRTMNHLTLWEWWLLLLNCVRQRKFACMCMGTENYVYSFSRKFVFLKFRCPVALTDLLFIWEKEMVFLYRHRLRQPKLYRMFRFWSKLFEVRLRCVIHLY